MANWFYLIGSLCFVVGTLEGKLRPEAKEEHGHILDEMMGE